MAGAKGRSGGARRGTGPKPRPADEQWVEARVKLPRELKAALRDVIGGGNISEGVRVAALAWLDVHAPARYPGRRVELWRYKSGARFAVLCEHGRPIGAAGPLTTMEAAEVIAGDTDFGWSSALADDINAEDEGADEAVYRRVWPEGKEE